jgi:hypothetical protein
MTALPPWSRGAALLGLLFADANRSLWDRRLALERFGQDQVRTVVSIRGSEICGVVLHCANDAGSLFF